jgi:hypothetical protein
MCGNPNVVERYFTMRDRQKEYTMCEQCTKNSIRINEYYEMKALKIIFKRTLRVLDVVRYDADGLPVALPADSTNAQKTENANLKTATERANAAHATYKRMLTTGTLEWDNKLAFTHLPFADFQDL